VIPSLDRVISGTAAFLGSIFGLGAVILYGSVTEAKNQGDFNFSIFLTSLKTTFYDVYDWPPFVIALAASSAATIFFAVMEACWYKYVRKIERPVPKHLLTDPYEDSTMNRDVTQTDLIVQT
jgi:hypothetical protein